MIISTDTDQYFNVLSSFIQYDVWLSIQKYSMNFSYFCLPLNENSTLNFQEASNVYNVFDRLLLTGNLDYYFPVTSPHGYLSNWHIAWR